MRRKMPINQMLAGATAFLSAGSLAQSPAPDGPATPPPPPCSTEEYRQLDFWVGEWIATWNNPDGTKGTGKNLITRDEYGPCVITERFSTDDGSLKGFSISTYFRAAGEWRQTWMDDQGGYYDLFGGPDLVPGAKFGLETYRRDSTAPFARMIWTDVKPDSFTWRWQKRATAKDEWRDSWVIDYRRERKESAGAGTK